MSAWFSALPQALSFLQDCQSHQKKQVHSKQLLFVRVAEETIEEQMLASGFANIKKHAVLPYHNFLIGEEKSASAQPSAISYQRQE